MSTLIPLSQSQGWVQIGTAISVAVVQASGDEVEIGYTGVGDGFDIPLGIPVSVPHVAEFGGNLYVRSRDDSGVRYEVA